LIAELLMKMSQMLSEVMDLLEAMWEKAEQLGQYEEAMIQAMSTFRTLRTG
jgi:Zn-dependent oligopeptidase